MQVSFWRWQSCPEYGPFLPPPPGISVPARTSLETTRCEASYPNLCGRGVSTNKEYVRGVSTNKEYVRGVSTNKEYVHGVSTNKEYVRGVSTNKEYVHGVVQCSI